MCGIAGFVDFGRGYGVERLKNIVLTMRETMVHRGPDDCGLWVDDSGMCALSHRRLSIIDLSSQGRQPMGNEEKTVHVTFNGEIYNFQQLRMKLQSEGHEFHSNTDTEILPHLFESFQPERLKELDGMFSFGLWHGPLQKLLLARDPFGKKPLYYSQGPGWFAFASELQALTCLPRFDDTIDQDALSLYLLLQYVPHPWTIYQNVKKLPPGAFLVGDFFSNQAKEPRVDFYYTFSAQEPKKSYHSLDDQVEELKTLMRESVQKRLISDVPLGAFLSGGVDSSLVVAIVAKELGRPIKTFSLGFENTDETEHLFAREIAEYLGTDHHEHILKPQELGFVEEIASMLDEPNGDSSCLPTFLLCQYARQFVTVALSGDGGDEMFGGYGRYRDTLLEDTHWWGRFKHLMKTNRWYTPADGYLSPRWLMFQPEQVNLLMGKLSPVIEELLQNWRTMLNAREQPLLHRMRNLDIQTYLPGAVLAKVDRMSMQVSLEVRCPILDKDVAQFAQSLNEASCWKPPDETKSILKRLASQYLPQKLMYRKKMGFGLPSSGWSRNVMLDMINEVLLSSSGKLGCLVDRSVLHSLMKQQGNPGSFSIYQVWPLLVLELWLRKSSRISV
jgi:asparagine synthase (glutamine-hydrolysing)